MIKSPGLSKVASSVSAGITCSSPDGQTGITADGHVVTADTNEPAIVYRNGECIGLQLLPAIENKLLWSGDFTQSSWSKSSADVELITEESPIEGASVYKLTESADSSGSIHRLQQSAPTGKGYGYFVVKAAKRTEAEVRAFSTSNNIAVFSLVDGSIISSSISSDRQPLSLKLNDGFFLLALPFEDGDTVLRLTTVLNGNREYIGDGVSGIYVTAAQWADGGLSDYVETTDSSKVRAEVELQENISLGQPFWFYAEIDNNAEGFTRDWCYLDATSQKRLFYSINKNEVRVFDGDSAYSTNVPEGDKVIFFFARVSPSEIKFVANGGDIKVMPHFGSFLDSSSFRLRKGIFKDAFFGFSDFSDDEAIALTALEDEA